MAVVARARLSSTEPQPELENVEVIWRHVPRVTGAGHYSHRLAFSPDGSVPTDNPFQDKGELPKAFWSLGHRNLLGIAFDQLGRLLAHEMGPRHGDEFNLSKAGDNFGWPIVSWW